MVIFLYLMEAFMRDKHILLIHFVLNFRLVFILVRALLLPRRALALPMFRRQGKFVARSINPKGN